MQKLLWSEPAPLMSPTVIIFNIFLVCKDRWSCKLKSKALVWATPLTAIVTYKSCRRKTWRWPCRLVPASGPPVSWRWWWPNWEVLLTWLPFGVSFTLIEQTIHSETHGRFWSLLLMGPCPSYIVWWMFGDIRSLWSTHEMRNWPYQILRNLPRQDRWQKGLKTSFLKLAISYTWHEYLFSIFIGPVAVGIDFLVSSAFVKTESRHQTYSRHGMRRYLDTPSSLKTTKHHKFYGGLWI